MREFVSHRANSSLRCLEDANRILPERAERASQVLNERIGDDALIEN
jgi:hypothetical protein